MLAGPGRFRGKRERFPRDVDQLAVLRMNFRYLCVGGVVWHRNRSSLLQARGPVAFIDINGSPTREMRRCCCIDRKRISGGFQGFGRAGGGAGPPHRFG